MGHARCGRTRGLVATVAILVSTSLTSTPASSADETGTDPTGVIGQLEGIRGELENIAGLLRAVEKQQGVMALMARIRLKQQRLSSIESQLRSTRGEQEAAEQEIGRLTAIEESWSQEEDGALSGDGLSEEQRRGLELMRQEKKSLASRVETLRMRVVELENDLARAREDILALEEAVDEQLGLR